MTTPDPQLHADGRASLMDRLVVVGFVVALLVPIAGGLMGLEPEQLEARDAATLPAFTTDDVLDTGTYSQVDRALADQFPLRSSAVRLHAAIDYGLLGGSTNPDVIVGRDGWLFAAQERDARCELTPDVWLADWDRAVAAAQAAGIELRYVFVPDKHSVYPDKVPSGTGLGTACTDAQRDAFRARLGERPDTIIDVFDELVAGRADDATRPIYFAQDTHWTPFGSIRAIERLVTSLDPDAWRPDEVSIGPPVSRDTDLSRLIGLPGSETFDDLRVREDVDVAESTVATDVDLDNAPSIPRYRVDPAVPAIEGTTLIVHDSYFGVDRARIRPWFRDSVWVHYNDLLAHPELVEDLPPIDRVVLERVERLTYNHDPAALLEPVLTR